MMSNISNKLTEGDYTMEPLTELKGILNHYYDSFHRKLETACKSNTYITNDKVAMYACSLVRPNKINIREIASMYCAWHGINEDQIPNVEQDISRVYDLVNAMLLIMTFLIKKHNIRIL